MVCIFLKHIRWTFPYFNSKQYIEIKCKITTKNCFGGALSCGNSVFLQSKELCHAIVVAIGQ